jgi:hypothetical protein
VSFVKHLIECNCILPQYKNTTSVEGTPVFHRFVVFSEVEDLYGQFQPSYVSCNHCGVIHRVTEVGSSEILNRESSLSTVTTQDIALELPELLKEILERHGCELYTWQEVLYLWTQKKWGSSVVLTRETQGENLASGKVLYLQGPTEARVVPYEDNHGFVSLV